MDRSGFRKRVLLDLIGSPWVLAPFTIGLTLLIGAWAVGRMVPALVFAGIAGVLGGLGALVTRWMTGHDDLAKKAYEKLQAEAARKQEQAFDRLHEQLVADGDPRTERSLDFIRDLYKRFAALLKDEELRPPPEIVRSIDKLLRMSVASLERSLKLWNTAQDMMTHQARQAVLDEREKILDEVNKSMGKLAQSIDNVKTMKLSNNQEQHLAALRGELDQSLDVARRIEQRMQDLEVELSPTGQDSTLE